jgi:hypothetical protein
VIKKQRSGLLCITLKSIYWSQKLWQRKLGGKKKRRKTWLRSLNWLLALGILIVSWEAQTGKYLTFNYVNSSGKPLISFHSTINGLLELFLVKLVLCFLKVNRAVLGTFTAYCRLYIKNNLHIFWTTNSVSSVVSHDKSPLNSQYLV